MTTAADDGRAARRDRIAKEVAQWPPFTDDDLAAIAEAVAPGWVLADRRAKPRPRRRKGQVKP